MEGAGVLNGMFYLRFGSENESDDQSVMYRCAPLYLPGQQLFILSLVVFLPDFCPLITMVAPQYQ